MFRSIQDFLRISDIPPQLMNGTKSNLSLQLSPAKLLRNMFRRTLPSFALPSGAPSLCSLQTRRCMFQRRHGQISRLQVSLFTFLHQTKSQLQDGCSFQGRVLSMPLQSLGSQPKEAQGILGSHGFSSMSHGQVQKTFSPGTLRLWKWDLHSWGWLYQGCCPASILKGSYKIIHCCQAFRSALKCIEGKCAQRSGQQSFNGSTLLLIQKINRLEEEIIRLCGFALFQELNTQSNPI
mmetsp:Transcript_4027/g.9376  ORF Transcript_4027/g.9376 Transcript_4027/m.9376 type:complete len:236 (-) Transcript_4027:184-891(-)